MKTKVWKCPYCGQKNPLLKKKGSWFVPKVWCTKCAKRSTDELEQEKELSLLDEEKLRKAIKSASWTIR